MKRLVVALYYAVKESFWFLPALMALAAAGASIGSVALDRHIGSGWVRGIALVWSGGAEGARSVLSVIAGSTMTVVSIVFSITITALAQTSAHFGPRVLRNFTRDRRNQFVLGAFVAAFLYSLLVLRTVRSESGDAFVPYVSVNLGIAFALLMLGVLIYFIHHIATSIQADLLVARIGRECLDVVAARFPESPGNGAGDPDPAPQVARRAEEGGDSVAADGVGFVQAVDESALFDAAKERSVLVTVCARPGDFVSPGQTLACVAPWGALDDRLADLVRAGFSIGERRTPEQDLAYSVQQLVEIAARALSPGVNEPFTAILCIEHLGAVLRSLAGRRGPPPLRRDDLGAVRLVAWPLAFPEIVELSLGTIRRYTGGSADVHLALLRTLHGLASGLRRPADRDALLFEVRQITHDALQVRNPHDRERVLDKARETRDRLRRAQLGTGRGS